MGRKCKKKNEIFKLSHIFINKNHPTPNKDFVISFFIRTFAN